MKKQLDFEPIEFTELEGVLGGSSAFRGCVITNGKCDEGGCAICNGQCGSSTTLKPSTDDTIIQHPPVEKPDPADVK